MSSPDVSPTLPGVLPLESAWHRASKQLWIVLLQLWEMLSPYVNYSFLFVFLFPVGICLGVYFSAFCLYLYRRDPMGTIKRLRRVVLEERDLLKAGKEFVSTLWDAQGYVWHGYEVIGLEHIPTEGPALVVYYHGALPVDYYYFYAKLLLTKQRFMHSVVDRFLFLIPGLGDFLKAFNCHPGSVDGCIELLKEGHLVGVAPGGVYEANFSSNNYEILWKDRMGAAKIALGAKCKVLPMFTANIREAVCTLTFLRRFIEPIYKKIKLPLMPMYGGFPVKLTTYIGPPIEYDPDTISVEELRDKMRDAIKALIDNHQKRPGSVIRALWQRVRREQNHVS